MEWIELREMWDKNALNLDAHEVAEARRILQKYGLRVTDIASPLFKMDWPGAPPSKYSQRDEFKAGFTFKQQDEVLDARARGVHIMLGPGVNIYRAPMCGRNFEYFGEDPFLASRMTVAYIGGMQSQGVSATIKHFMGNNQEFLRHGADSIIDERTMREIYLPTFEAAVKEAHVGAIMDSYNLTNGEHMTQNGHLNNDVVKKEWGFDGIIMSDWDATYDGVAAANGGLDLEMPSAKFMNRAGLLPATVARTAP